jgi:GTPase SAR1 family protein
MIRWLRFNQSNYEFNGLDSMEDHDYLSGIIVKNLDTNEVKTLLDVEREIRSNYSIKYFNFDLIGASLVLHDDILYIFGGEHKNPDDFNNQKVLIRAFDTKYNRMYTLPDDDISPLRRKYASSFAFNNKLYFIGGVFSTNIFHDVFSYDPKSNRWQFETFLPNGLYGHTSVDLGGFIYTFGGCGNDNSSCNNFFTLNLSNFSVNEVSPPLKNPPPRHFHACTTFKESIFIFGGKWQKLLQTDHSIVPQGLVSGYEMITLDLNDLWMFQNNQWREIQTELSSPSPPLLFSNDNYLHLLCGTNVYEADPNFQWRHFKSLSEIGTSSIEHKRTIYTINIPSKAVTEQLTLMKSKDILDRFVRDQAWLLLGAGEVGKSTIYNQLKKIYGYDIDIGAHYGVIVENILTSLKRCNPYIDERRFRDYFDEFTDNLSQFSAEQIWTSELHLKICRLKFVFLNFVEKVYEIPNLYLFDGIEHFLQNIENYVHEFVPTFEDGIYSYRKTTGGTEFTIRNGLINYRFMDTGGQRNERKKWYNFLKLNANCVFVVNLCGLWKKCYEDDDTNRLIEDLLVYDIVNSPFFLDQPILLLFNKLDRFERVISECGDKDLEKLFPGQYVCNDRDNASKKIESALKFIINCFKRATRGSLSRLRIHLISAVDTKSVQNAFESVKSFEFIPRIQRDNFIDVVFPQFGDVSIPISATKTSNPFGDESFDDPW